MSTRPNETAPEHEPDPVTEDRANLMWGGRFSGGPAEAMARINASIDFDRRLYAQDSAASKAHCAMLVAQGIVSTQVFHDRPEILDICLEGRASRVPSTGRGNASFASADDGLGFQT